MAYITLSSGLTLQIPTKGTVDWYDTFQSEFAQPISEHDHTGGGAGLTLGVGSLTNGELAFSADYKGVRVGVEATKSAAGTVQADASNVLKRIVICTTVAAGSGIKLPTNSNLGAGAVVRVKNKGANALNIYPNTGDQINALGANVAYSLASGSSITLVRTTTTQWETF